MEQTLVEVDLTPSQSDQLTHAQSMPIGYQDHCAVAVALPTNLTGGADQSIDLGWSEVFPAATIYISGFLRRSFHDITENDGWCSMATTTELVDFTSPGRDNITYLGHSRQCFGWRIWNNAERFWKINTSP